jgi:hypothetical protein
MTSSWLKENAHNCNEELAMTPPFLDVARDTVNHCCVSIELLRRTTTIPTKLSTTTATTVLVRQKEREKQTEEEKGKKTKTKKRRRKRTEKRWNSESCTALDASAI